MGKLRRLPKSPVLRIKHLERRLLNRRENARRHPPTASRKRLRLRNRTLQHLRLLDHVAMLFRIRVGNAQQYAPKAGTPVPIARGKISPTIKWLPIRSEERCQRPSALPAHRLHRCLIPAVNIRTLVAIHLHRDEMLVHNRRNLRIVIRFPIHHMTPVTPHRPNVEQHRLVLPLRRGKGLGAPFMPLNRLMHGRPQISGRSAREGVEGGGCHSYSLNASSKLSRSRHHSIVGRYNDPSAKGDRANPSCIRIRKPMRSVFPGYFTPTKKEFAKLWGESVFAFDANVLLGLYRSTSETQQVFFTVLDKIADRMFLPNQAAFGYLKNRLGVIS